MQIFHRMPRLSAFPALPIVPSVSQLPGLQKCKEGKDCDMF